MNQLYALFGDYNKRFVNGVYVKNEDQIHSFTMEQEALAASFKSSGALKSILSITNDFDASLSVKFFVLVDEQNNAIGFYYEKSKYDSDNERSFLRFRFTSEYEKGINFVPVGGAFALTIKAFYIKPESATLRFIYLTDKRKATTSAMDLFLLKKNNSWDLYNTSYQLIHTAHVAIWFSLFPPSAGVKKVVLQ